MEPQIDTERTQCIRCGACCFAAGPTLQKTDLPLFFNHVVEGLHLYAIRKGELVRDNINDALKFTDQEMIKIGELSGKGCILYDNAKKACTIYADRPSQCRAFACWDDSAFNEVFSEPKANRKDMIRDANLLRLISAHEKTCDYRVISDYGRPLTETIHMFGLKVEREADGSFLLTT